MVRKKKERVNMNETNKKTWALIDAAIPIEIGDVKIWMKSMTNGQKIKLAMEIQEGKNLDATMTSLAKHVVKLEMNGRMIEDNDEIVKLFVHLDNFETQTNIVNAALNITGLKDVERKNSQSSSAT